MKRSTGSSKKRILIVVVWIIFLVVFGFVAFRVEYHRCSENGQKDLVRQAGNIGLLTSAIFYNDQYVQDCIDKTMPIRMRVLAGGLEKYEDIEDAMMLLEGFQSEAGLESLAVYDAKGNVLYGDGELGAELNLDPDEIKRILTTGGKDSEDGQIGIETVGDRWLLIGKNKESFNQKLMENYYSWRHSLEILTGEMTTDIISISTENGTILFDSDDLMTGLSMKEADIQTQDGTALTNTQELKSLFTDSDQSVLIQIDGEPYFASLISSPQEDMLLVAIMSEQAVTDEASYVVTLIFLFVFLVTGLCTAYAYFHISRQRKECSDEEGRGRRTPALATGLTISGAVAVIAVIGFSIYIAALSMYSNAYKNGREMLDHAQTLYSTNLEGSEVVKNWSDEEYLTRTRMARCVLMDQDQKETTKEYLISLAGTLEVQDISVYDKTGSFQASALYYFQPNIEQNSPFYVLLQGENYVVGDPEENGNIKVWKSNLLLRLS